MWLLFVLLAVSSAGWFDILFPSEGNRMSNAKTSRVNRIHVQSGTIEKDATNSTEIVNFRTMVDRAYRPPEAKLYFSFGLYGTPPLIPNQAAPQALAVYEFGNPFFGEENESQGAITPDPNTGYTDVLLEGPAYYHAACTIQGHPVDRTKQGFVQLTTTVVGAYPLNNGQIGEVHKSPFYPNSDSNIDFDARTKLVFFVPEGGATLTNTVDTLLRPLGGDTNFEIRTMYFTVHKLLNF